MKMIELLGCLALLAAFTSAVKIECRYTMLNWEVPTYSCAAMLLSTEDPSSVTDVIGTHMQGRENEDVKAFWATGGHEHLTQIPKDIENFFGNLEYFYWESSLSLSKSGLSTIDASTFENFPNLLLISLSSNKLVTLNGDIFHHTPKLRWIYLDNNLLKTVGHGLLTGLADLTGVWFEANPCTQSNANTPQQIQELNLQLPIQCPPPHNA